MKTKPLSVSVIIRNYNEAHTLVPLIYQVLKQDYRGQIEVIVVDNESSDDSVNLAKKAGAKVVSIGRNDFTYPKASNLGAAHSKADIIAYTSAHSQLIDASWLGQGISNFADEHVVGAYGHQWALPDSPISEKIFYNWSRPFSKFKDSSPKLIHESVMGTMGAANCFMRRSYFEKHPYDTKYGAGGEDQAWAATALGLGKIIIYDPKLTIYHSHKLTAKSLFKQISYWKSLAAPQPYDRERLNNYRGKKF